MAHAAAQRVIHGGQGCGDLQPQTHSHSNLGRSGKTAAPPNLTSITRVDSPSTAFLLRIDAVENRSIIPSIQDSIRRNQVYALANNAAADLLKYLQHLLRHLH
ncbi:Thymidine phosphorylase [Apodemus speciosus]|uniref:Thymidine phosphorylase n=1 Tax=Apodemus speciosus TaxID=105296 RepID=A0ABQ0FKI6_APOSI